MQHFIDTLPGAGFFSVKRDFIALALTAVLGLPGTSFSAGSASASMSVSATVLSTSNCKFNNPGTATLAFGAVDPSGVSNVTATGTLVIRCGGSAPNATFAITDDSGLYETGVGAYRMRHAVTTTAYLGYSVGYSPQSATIPKNTDQTITITGTITPTQFGNAIAGNFADTVTITVSP